MHWFYIAISLDKEISSLDEPSSKTLIGRLLLEENKPQEYRDLSLVEDELSNRHSLGYLAVDVLLKLGPYRYRHRFHPYVTPYWRNKGF
jgi:hypothetical protein